MPTKIHTKTITKPKRLGQTLRQARESRGVSQATAAATLHIPLNQLEALEQDEAAGVFAAPVYAFGALRSYASWLGIESRQLERTLASQLREAKVERSQLEVHTLPFWYEQLLNARTVVTAAGVLAALIVGSYVAWQIRSFWRLPDLRVTSPTESITEADRVVIAGTTEEGAHIKINEQSVALKDNNYFEQEVPLAPGVTIVRVEAENVAGRVRTVEKHLLRLQNTGTVK